MGSITRNVKVRYDKNHIRLNKGELVRKDGRYVYSWFGADNKRHFIYAQTLDELRKMEAQIQKDRDDGIREDANCYTINDVFRLWQETKRGLKDHTKKSYIYFYELFVKPVLGQKRIQHIRRTDIKSFYNHLIDARGIKISTLDNVHTVLHQVFQLAVEDNIIRANPTDRVLTEIKRATGKDTEPREALTCEQEKLFFDTVRKTPNYQKWYPILYIMDKTGMRIGEISGLRWCDVDLENDMISINHTLVYYNHRDEKGCYYSINSPKTFASKRNIPITPSVKEAFLMQREYLELTGLTCQDHIDGYDDFIFLNRNGNVFNQSTVNTAIQRIVRDINLEILEKAGDNEPSCIIPYFSCHILRHTFATRMIEAGISIKILQEILGHADFKTTMNVYVNITDSIKKKELNKFDEYIKLDKELSEKEE